MRKILAIAALLLASTTAQAQYTFEYGGRTIRVDPDRGTVSIPGVYDNTGRKAKRSRNEEGDRDRSRKQTPQQAKTAPQTTPDVAAPAAAPAASEQAVAPAIPAPPTASTTEASTTTAAVASTGTATAPPPAPPVQQDAAPAAKPAPAPTVAVAPPVQAVHRSGNRSGRELTARPVADRGEGRPGQDRTVRRQPLRLFRRQDVKPEWRTGFDQHEARQGLQMERPDSRSEHRQHL